MNTELKHCPFCKGEADLYQRGLKLQWKCGCSRCDIWFYGTKQQVTQLWNTRADGWIPVTERVPEDERRVLVLWGVTEKRHGEAQFKMVHGERRWFDCDWEYVTITHWRELPELPKEDK